MTFAIPKELEDDYSFTPGQYLTLRTTHGRRGSAPLLFDLLRPRRRRAAHRREEGRWRRVLELGRRRIEVRRRTRRDDADRPLRHRPCARRGADLCRLCRRLRHHADPVDRQGRAGARAGQPLLSVLRQPLDIEHAVPRSAGGTERPLHAAAFAVPCDLGRRAGHPDPARPARWREGEGTAALAGAGRERRSRLHLRPHRDERGHRGDLPRDRHCRGSHSCRALRLGVRRQAAPEEGHRGVARRPRRWRR